MEVDEKAGGGDSSSRVMPSFVKSGDRQMFTVELRPGDTTIVSWKKLLKDANKVNSGSGSASVAAPPAAAPTAMQSALEPRAVQSQPAEQEPKDAAQPNRYSAVIEKIERLYMGKDSSDDEDLNDIPDDDQYDTEDSFIDDAELDEYFEVDKATVKHDGFFVNRGKLECINEAAAQPNQQQKKRRRKDLFKGNGEKDDGNMPNKHVKMGKNATRRVAPQSVSMMAKHYEDGRFPDQVDISGSGSKKKSADNRVMLDFSSSTEAANGDVPTAFAENRSAEKQNSGVTQARNITYKVKDSSGSLDSMHQKYHDRTSLAQSKSQSGKLLDSSDEIESLKRSRQKQGMRDVPDLNMLDSRHAETSRTVLAHRKDGSAVRPKGSLLEKAIRDLEKMVAESRPPTTENQEGDNSSQAVKRRLPNEMKLKLAKVARLAQSSHGKISKELVIRLDSILGHLIQLRTLKRNLKIMVNMSLSAKQEKESRFQQIKKEVADMVRIGVQSSESKVLEQHVGASDDFQDYGGTDRRKYQMDAAMEDKICDLYDLYVDVMDEETGPQVRKLYAELAGLWPNALMDNHGIKRAICRAKERKKSLYNRHKAEEKIQRKKLLAPKPEPATVRAESGSGGGAQPQPQPNNGTERLAASEVSVNVSTSGNKAIPIPARVSGPPSIPTVERAKNDKGKGGTTSHSGDEARLSEAAPATTAVTAKKKAKRKPEVDLNEMPAVEKLPSQYGEINKKPKQTTTSSGVHKAEPSAGL